MIQDQEWQTLQSSFQAYRAGQATATRALFEGLTKKLRQFYLHRIKNQEEAHDLTQAALLKIHFARDRFDETQSLKTWVYTIAGRALIDHWRGLGTESEIFETIESASEDQASPLDQVASLDLTPDQKTLLNQDLNAALNTLKPIDRSIVYLYGVEGFSMAEIAEIVGLSEAATKLRAHRSYKELRQKL